MVCKLVALGLWRLALLHDHARVRNSLHIRLCVPCLPCFISADACSWQPQSGACRMCAYRNTQSAKSCHVQHDTVLLQQSDRVPWLTMVLLWRDAQAVPSFRPCTSRLASGDGGTPQQHWSPARTRHPHILCTYSHAARVASY
jgi:hypothetical protein